MPVLRPTLILPPILFLPPRRDGNSVARASAMAVGGVGVAGCATGVMARVGRFLRCGGSCQRYGGGRRGCGTHSADHLDEKWLTWA